jgi:hypothetical protein
VIACIRKFDLRYSRDLLDLFPRTGQSSIAPEFIDPEFPFVRHFNVPLLSDGEIFQLKSKAHSLYDIHANTSNEQR